MKNKRSNKEPKFFTDKFSFSFFFVVFLLSCFSRFSLVFSFFSFSAYALLHPAQYAGMGVEDKDFLDGREMKELQTLFGNAGMKLNDSDFDQVFGRARTLSMMIEGGRRGVGIEVFRRAYNEYDDARFVQSYPNWWVHSRK